MLFSILVSSCVNEGGDSKLSSEKNIISFDLIDSINVDKEIISDLKVDTANFTISLNVPYNVVLKDLKPLIDVSKKAKVSTVSGKEVNFELVPDSKPKVYTEEFKVVAEDGSAQKYTVNITKLPSSACSIRSFVLNRSKNKTNIFGNRQARINEDTVPPTVTLRVSENANLNGLMPTIDHTGVSISPMGSSTIFKDKTPVMYTVEAANGRKKEYKVIISKSLSSSSAIESFKFKAEGNNRLRGNIFKEVHGVIDNKNKRVTVMVPYNAVLSELSPEIRGHRNAKVKSLSARNLESADLNYVVTAEDGTTTKYNVHVEKGPEPKISSFKLNADISKNISTEITATIDNASKETSQGEIVLKVPFDADLSSLTPRIVVENSPFAAKLYKAGVVSSNTDIIADFSNSHLNPIQYSVEDSLGGLKIYNVKIYKEPRITDFKFVNTDNNLLDIKTEYVGAIQQGDNMSDDGVITFTVANGTDFSSLKPSYEGINVNTVDGIIPAPFTEIDSETLEAVYAFKYEHFEGYEKRYTLRITKEIAPKLTNCTVQANTDKGFESDVTAEFIHNDDASVGVIRLKFSKDNDNDNDLSGLDPIISVPEDCTLSSFKGEDINESIGNYKFILTKNDTGVQRLYSVEAIKSPYIERLNFTNSNIKWEIDHANDVIRLDLFSLDSEELCLLPTFIAKNGIVAIDDECSYTYDKPIVEPIDFSTEILCKVISTDDPKFTKTYTIIPDLEDR
ncbi:pkd domain containing protein [Ichthyobacterium seriolicida]|uniref:Pkd domain containing protein n=2 Tax=Ichthyobacterium seriolicida TaxID=242600 RepID=A0A1J1DZZ4_9FLAO|nr:pkd domain containing protein [Ichthyobacterium seriolicida]